MDVQVFDYDDMMLVLFLLLLSTIEGPVLVRFVCVYRSYLNSDMSLNFHSYLDSEFSLFYYREVLFVNFPFSWVYVSIEVLRLSFMLPRQLCRMVRYGLYVPDGADEYSSSLCINECDDSKSLFRKPIFMCLASLASLSE